jgi:hypothetical protein
MMWRASRAGVPMTPRLLANLSAIADPPEMTKEALSRHKSLEQFAHQGIVRRGLLLDMDNSNYFRSPTFSITEKYRCGALFFR